MKIVIDIPEEDWKFLKESDGCRWSGAIIEGIINGTPLPKGHGKLKDENEIKRIIEEAKVNSEHSKTFAENIIRFAPTIIEADKAESEDKT